MCVRRIKKLLLKKFAFIEEEENKQLFLSLISGGNDFFKIAAKKRRFSAFILGNKIVEKACSNRNEISFNQCVAAFYCHLRGAYLNQGFFRGDDLEEGIGREIDLMDCDRNDYYDEFKDPCSLKRQKVIGGVGVKNGML